MGPFRLLLVFAVVSLLHESSWARQGTSLDPLSDLQIQERPVLPPPPRLAPEMIDHEQRAICADEVPPHFDLVHMPDSPGFLSTPFNSNNAAAGNMFDITPKRDLQLTALDVNLDNAGSNCVIAVWLRTGTYVGHETSGVGWYLLDLVSVTSAGLNAPTRVDLSHNNETLSANQVYGIYVDLANYGNTPAHLCYTNGSTILLGNDMNFSGGIGMGGPSFTGTVFSPRTWNGTLFYNTSLTGTGQLTAAPPGGNLISTGSMFNFRPLRDMAVNYVDLHTDNAGMVFNVDVWLHNGSWVGHEHNPSAWQHLASGIGTSNGQGSFTRVDLACNDAVILKANTIYGLYVDTGWSTPLRMHNASAPPSTSNLDAVYTAGASILGKTFSGTVYSGESFCGRVGYVTSGLGLGHSNSFSGGASAAGNMFDIEPKFDLRLTGMDLNLSVGQPSVRVDVYWINGGYAGHENSSTGWTLLTSQTVEPQGAGGATFIDLSSATTVFQSGARYGLYVALSSYGQGSQAMNYSVGTGSYNHLALNIHAGVGKGHPLFTGPTYTGREWNGRIFFDPIDAPNLYCNAKLNSQGCKPLIDWSGVPSATATSGFSVRCNNVINNKNGLLLYTVNGSGTNTPFQGGTLCVGGGPVRRTTPRNSLGSAPPVNDCSGVFVIDMNSFSHGFGGGNPDPGLKVSGNRIWVQWWGRDSGFAAPNNSMLSNALYYTVQP